MLKKILVPIDFTDTSVAAMRKAAELSELILLYADEFQVTSYGEIPYLPSFVIDEHTAEIKQKMADVLTLAKAEGWNARGVVVQGPAADGIASVAETEAADLIVMGTHGRRGFRRFMMGSVAERIVRTSKIPVMTVCMPSSAQTTSDAA
jgi:nucleotide-binding universal stress UspA family protein